jgi:hypothetical protein
MRIRIGTFILAGLSTAVGSIALEAAELTVLAPGNWTEFAPKGKEVDAIYGDLVLRNAKFVAVVARPGPNRNANMTTRNVGGAVIDLTLRSSQSDQLTAFYPANHNFSFEFQSAEADGKRVERLEDLADENLQGSEVCLVMVSRGPSEQPRVEVTYRLGTEADTLLVETRYVNTSSAQVKVDLIDRVRIDNSRDRQALEKLEEGRSNFFWAHDKWFDQAYGILAKEREATVNTGRRGRSPSELRYLVGEEPKLTLQPGEVFLLTRWVFPGTDLLHVKAIAGSLLGVQQRQLAINVVDASGLPVPGSVVQVFLDGELYGSARSGKSGDLTFQLPRGRAYAYPCQDQWWLESVVNREVRFPVKYSSSDALVRRIPFWDRIAASRRFTMSSTAQTVSSNRISRLGGMM